MYTYIYDVHIYLCVRLEICSANEIISLNKCNLIHARLPCMY